MVKNRPIVVIINTDRIRQEMRHHHSPAFSEDTNFGMNLENILQLLSAMAPHVDDLDMVAEMSYDIADSMEFMDGNDYTALVTLLNDTARFVKKDLHLAASRYPNKQAYFDRLVGNSAFFLLE